MGDIPTLIILILFSIRGFHRGFIRELFLIAQVSLLLFILLYSKIIINSSLFSFVFSIIIFLSVSIPLNIGKVAAIKSIQKHPTLSNINKILGGMAGTIIGCLFSYFLCLILVIFANLFSSQNLVEISQLWLDNSFILQGIEDSLRLIIENTYRYTLW